MNKDLQNIVDRMFRRKAIKDAIRKVPVGRGESVLQNVIATSRREEQKYDAGELVHQLKTEINAPDAERLAVLDEVIAQLRIKFDIPSLSFVVMGSSAHGGAQIRRLSNDYTNPDRKREPSDVDVFLGVENRNILTKANTKAIYEYANQIIGPLAKSHGLPDADTIHICSEYGKRLLYYPVEEIQDTKHALKMLNYPVDAGDLILYFHPSVPEEFNLINQEFLLSALHILYKRDRALWKSTCESLYSNMKIMKILKPKHFGQPGFTSTGAKTAGKQLHEISATEVNEPFKRLLESTGEPF